MIVNEECKKIQHVAVRALARREYAFVELSRFLVSKGYDSVKVTAVLSAFVEEGLISDARFSEAYVNYRCSRGDGSEKIRMELRKRGVDQETITQYLDNADIDWSKKASEVRCKRFGESMPEDYNSKAKQMRFLAQRGFSNECIQSVFSSYVY